MDVDAFHKRLRELYLPPKEEFSLVDVPQIRFMAIDGEGDPAKGAMEDDVKWLFAIARIVKPAIKARMGKNFAEPPLECLFWAETPQAFIDGDKDRWKWRVMLVLVDWISQAQFEDAVAEVAGKYGPAPGTLGLRVLHEGRSVQIRHVGNYRDIGAICQKLYGSFLPEHGLTPRGPYHEIYLNNPKRTAADKRNIVIRQPVE